MRIRFGKLFTPVRIYQDMCLRIENGVVEEIEKCRVHCDFHFPIITPGFIDSHTHGAVGIDIMSATVDDFQKLSIFYAKHGVTTFLPTTVSDTFEKISRVAETVKKFMNLKPEGARVAGMYIEGPYLNPSRKGAHKEDLLKRPDLDELSRFVERFGDVVRIFAIAPELEDSGKVIDFLKKKKIIPTIAHTDATYDQAVFAIENGCTRATHVFNAMRTFSHREPGVVGAVLTDKRVFCEIISDMIHLHPTTVMMIMNIKGPYRSVLVTDSIAATGLEDGEYWLGELQVVVQNKVARTKQDQSLAGSTLTLDEAVRNIVFKLNINARNAIMMATYSAARSSNLDLGRIVPGSLADLVALDENLNILATFVSGEMVFKS